MPYALITLLKRKLFKHKGFFCLPNNGVKFPANFVSSLHSPVFITYRHHS